MQLCVLQMMFWKSALTKFKHIYIYEKYLCIILSSRLEILPGKGSSTNPLWNLFQSLIDLTIQKLFLVHHLLLPWYSFKANFLWLLVECKVMKSSHGIWWQWAGSVQGRAKAIFLYINLPHLYITQDGKWLSINYKSWLYRFHLTM